MYREDHVQSVNQSAQGEATVAAFPICVVHSISASIPLSDPKLDTRGIEIESSGMRRDSNGTER